MNDEFRPVRGYEDLYEMNIDGVLYARERVMRQDDVAGRHFNKVKKRQLKTITKNGRGYPAYNLHKNGRQTCRLISTLLRETWNREVDPRYRPERKS